MTFGSPRLRTVDLPPVSGGPGLTQGVYGAAGNLELVIPAADGGLWVFWYNADPQDGQHGAARGEWSGGLHFGGAHRTAAACITQMRAGPAFLEVVACGGGPLRRYCWTPERGFTDKGVVATGVAGNSPLVEAPDGTVHLLATAGGGRLVHLSASADDYPALTWRQVQVEGLVGATTASLLGAGSALRAAVVRAGRAELLEIDGQWRPAGIIPGRWRSASLLPSTVVGLDPEGRLQCSVSTSSAWRDPEPVWPGRRWTAAAAAATTLDGGRIDVVAVAADAVWHGYGRAGNFRAATWQEPRLVQSRVWVTDPSAPIHRRVD